MHASEVEPLSTSITRYHVWVIRLRKPTNAVHRDKQMFLPTPVHLAPPQERASAFQLESTARDGGASLLGQMWSCLYSLQGLRGSYANAILNTPQSTLPVWCCTGITVTARTRSRTCAAGWLSLLSIHHSGILREVNSSRLPQALPWSMVL